MKESEKMHLKSTINESTLSTADAVPLPQRGRCPEGAEVGWGKRDEKERGRSSQAGDIRKYPIHRWRGPPSPMGKATIREYRFPHNVKANTRICGKNITTDKAFPSRGRCPVGADRALAAGKTDEESGTARNIWGKRESLGKDFSLRPK